MGDFEVLAEELEGESDERLVLVLISNCELPGCLEAYENEVGFGIQFRGYVVCHSCESCFLRRVCRLSTELLYCKEYSREYSWIVVFPFGSCSAALMPKMHLSSGVSGVPRMYVIVDKELGRIYQKTCDALQNESLLAFI